MGSGGIRFNLDDPMSNRRFSILAIVAGGCFIAAMLALQDWSSSDPEAQVASSAVPLHAETVKVGRERVLLTDELPGRVAAFKKVEIRPQVSGIIKRKLLRPAPVSALVRSFSRLNLLYFWRIWKLHGPH